MCRCGNRGCLETVVSVSALAAQIAHTHPGVVSGPRFLPQVDDPVTERILDGAGRTLGGVLASFCNLLNPSALIVGGELGTTSTGAFVAGVATAVRQHAQPAIAAGLVILPAGLGTRAELLGALRLATTLVPH